MANQKQGLDYFDLSVNFFDDDKIALIEAELGVEGSYIAIRLLTKIYRINGYYMQWGEDERLLFARGLPNVNADTVQRAVELLVKRGFFDAGIYKEHCVLTSRAIQRRYFAAVKRRNADNKERKYYLLDDSAYIMLTESGKMSTESGKMSTGDKKERSKERIRVEESRVEESRVDTPPLTPPHGKREVGVSEARGGALSVFFSSEFSEVRSMLEKCRVEEYEIFEFLRLVNAAEIKSGYARATAEAFVRQPEEARRANPFYTIVQAHQQLERQGRLHPMISYEDFRILLFIHRNLLGSDQNVIFNITDRDQRLWDECKRLVNEVLRPTSNINTPGKFVISGLRKLQSKINQQFIKP